MVRLVSFIMLATHLRLTKWTIFSPSICLHCASVLMSNITLYPWIFSWIDSTWRPTTSTLSCWMRVEKIHLPIWSSLVELPRPVDLLPSIRTLVVSWSLTLVHQAPLPETVLTSPIASIALIYCAILLRPWASPRSSWMCAKEFSRTLIISRAPGSTLPWQRMPSLLI